MTVIDRDTVKTNLGIANDHYDARIDAQIPIIDAKVKQICGFNFNNQVSLTTTSGSPYAEIWTIWYWWGGRRARIERNDPLVREVIADINTGTYMEGENIPRTSVLEVYYDGSAEFGGTTYSAPFVTLADNATGTGSGKQAFYGWNKAYDSVVSKGIAWLLDQQSLTINDNTWTSKSYGPVSITRGTSGGDTKMDQKSGMPLWFVKAMPRHM